MSKSRIIKEFNTHQAWLKKATSGSFGDLAEVQEKYDPLTTLNRSSLPTIGSGLLNLIGTANSCLKDLKAAISNFEIEEKTDLQKPILETESELSTLKAAISQSIIKNMDRIVDRLGPGEYEQELRRFTDLFPDKSKEITEKFNSTIAALQNPVDAEDSSPKPSI